MLSFSQDAAKLKAIALRYGSRIGTPKEAAAFADVVVLAVPWSSVPTALQQAVSLDGKVLFSSRSRATDPAHTLLWARVLC
jgi:predicted dinucleotide-binding enzyme